MKYKLFLCATCLVSIYIILIGCSKTLTAEQQNARKELEKKGIPYNTEAFFEKIPKGNLDTLNLFFTASMSPNAEKQGMPALHWAVMIGDNATLKLLLDKGAKVDIKIKSTTPLLFAANLENRADKIKILIDKGANINQKSKYGSTALILASQNGDIETAKILLSNGADINIKDNDGKTALMFAKEKGNAEIVKLLQQAGAKE